MAILTFEVKTYTVLLGCKIGVGMTNLPYVPAVIQCKGAAGETFLVAFGPDVSSSKAFTYLGQKRGGIPVPVSELPNYIDLLRNEKPIYAQISDTQIDNLNLLKTDPEPVGEGE